MTETQAVPHLLTVDPCPVAVLREVVPLSTLPQFFDRAFQAVPAVLSRQQITITGPPLAIYFGMPTDTVDVAGGVPSAGMVVPEDGVGAFTLPGGRVARVVHRGSYDTLGESYGLLTEWMGEHSLTPGPLMWESYLTEPEPGGDPMDLLTEISWPVAEAAAPNSDAAA
ncbi:GyrI-like domain-containing protein [Microcella sp.]|uniref:GyrI-like domain-containing protein n=1 Tax=Microcella sp. TaxID=1913979 RepID=UPI002565FAF6|nr:GyrI-like domain-containing protein [Microcella sp.]MBX9472194.1 GyrI-like domain-containing protein [Microcella sp.]